MRKSGISRSRSKKKREKCDIKRAEQLKFNNHSILFKVKEKEKYPFSDNMLELTAKSFSKEIKVLQILLV